VTWHGPEPVQAPLHPAKAESIAGVAIVVVLINLIQGRRVV